MKAKNQPPISSEFDAKEKLIVYVYEYLCHSGARRAAETFLQDIDWNGKAIQTNPEGPGFLVNWWCVFWDLYCAAPDRRDQPEPSNEARAFREFNMRPVISPSCTQTSPPQLGQPFMFGSGPMMGGPRYGSHPGHMQRVPINVGPRMHNMGQAGPPLLMGGPHQPHPPMMGAGSPRYVTHPGHMTPGSSNSSGPMVPELGPSPGPNRMTPNHIGSPHPQMGPLNGTPPISGPPSGHHGGPPLNQAMAQVGPVQPVQSGVGPQQQPQAWQGNFNMNSQSDQQCFVNPGSAVLEDQQGEFNGMMMNDVGMIDEKTSADNSGSQNQSDEYVISDAYEQQDDHGESGSELLKLKESLENNTRDYSENEQSGFDLDFQ